MQKITRKLGTEFRRFLLFRGGYGGFDDDASVSVHVTGERGHFSAKTKRNRAIYRHIALNCHTKQKFGKYDIIIKVS